MSAEYPEIAISYDKNAQGCSLILDGVINTDFALGMLRMAESMLEAKKSKEGYSHDEPRML